MYTEKCVFIRKKKRHLIKLFIILFIYIKLSKTQDTRHYDYSHIRPGVFHIRDSMNDIIQNSRIKLEQIEKIRQLNLNSASYEIGYLIHLIQDKWRKMLDRYYASMVNGPAPLYLFDLIIFLEEIEHGYFQVDHLIRMLSQVERKYGIDTPIHERYFDKTAIQEQFEDMNTKAPRTRFTLGKPLGPKKQVGEFGLLHMSASSGEAQPEGQLPIPGIPLMESGSASGEFPPKGEKKPAKKPPRGPPPGWKPPGAMGPPGADRPEFSFGPQNPTLIPAGMTPPPGAKYPPGFTPPVIKNDTSIGPEIPVRPGRPGKGKNKPIPQTKYTTRKTRKTKRTNKFNWEKVEDRLKRFEEATAFLYGNFTKKNTTRWWWPIEYGWEIDEAWYL